MRPPDGGPLAVPRCPRCDQGDDEVVGLWYPPPVLAAPLGPDGVLTFTRPAGEPVAYQLRDGCRVETAEWRLVVTAEDDGVTRRVRTAWRRAG